MFYYVIKFHNNRKYIHAVKAKRENCAVLITQPVDPILSFFFL